MWIWEFLVRVGVIFIFSMVGYACVFGWFQYLCWFLFLGWSFIISGRLWYVRESWFCFFGLFSSGTVTWLWRRGLLMRWGFIPRLLSLNYWGLMRENSNVYLTNYVTWIFIHLLFELKLLWFNCWRGRLILWCF